MLVPYIHIARDQRCLQHALCKVFIYKCARVWNAYNFLTRKILCFKLFNIYSPWPFYFLVISFHHLRRACRTQLRHELLVVTCCLLMPSQNHT